MALSEAHIQALCQIDQRGRIFKHERKTFPGLHFCPDWDFLAICDASPESKSCTCQPMVRAALGEKE